MRKPRVLLVSAYKNGSIRVGQYISPSIGVHRIAAYLRNKKSAHVDVIDPDIEGEIYLYEKVKEGYDIIGISMLYPTLPNDLTIVEKVHSLSPNSLIVAGGQGAVFCSEFLLNNFPIDIVAKGLGEYAMADILDSYPNGPFTAIPALAVKTSKGIIHTKDIQNYSTENFRDVCMTFDYDMVPYEIYWRIMENHYTSDHLKIMKNENMVRTIRINTASHCNRGCTFCSSTNYFREGLCSQNVMYLTAKDILDSMKQAIKSHPKTTSFFFTDDNFLHDRKRALELCDMIQKEHSFKALTLFCLARTDSVDPELLTSLKNSGFKFIIFGVESFSNKILRHMNKKISHKNPQEHQKEILKKTIEHGITPLFNIILFFPSSEVEDIVETIESSLEMVESGARLTVYGYVEVYPGSSIMKDTTYEYKYCQANTHTKEMKMQKYILPNDKRINELADRAMDLRERIINNILRKNNWGVIPHPLYGLALFKAVYNLIDRDTSRIDLLIKKIITEEGGWVKNGENSSTEAYV